MPCIFNDDVVYLRPNILLLFFNLVQFFRYHHVFLINHVHVKHESGAGDDAGIGNLRNQPVILPKLLLPNEHFIRTGRRHDVLQPVRLYFRT